MTNGTKLCPNCGSNETYFIDKAGIYFCKRCNNTFDASNRSTHSSNSSEQIISGKKLKIFLSYGHDRNEELVLKIKSDLQALGHDVWIDKEEIKFGDDWRRSITEGITSSDLMLSFLSKHSTRVPGVCLDELSIALGTKSGIVQTILVESEKDVIPPVSVSHIQWLDMHAWKDHWEDSNKAPSSDGWYEEKLAQIIRVIESENSYRFSGEIELLKKKLLPITSDARIGWLLRQGFEGRDWLTQDINNWRLNNLDSRVFFLTGEPGIGKSAFAAWLAHHNKANIIAAHFIEYNKPDYKDPRRIITSIAFQIAARLSDYRKLLMELPELDRLNEKSAPELFSYLLSEPLSPAILGGRDRYVVIIDALDEASDDSANSLVDIIAQETAKLPKWITFFITSRPNPNILRRLSSLSPMKLEADDSRNRKDVSDFLHKWIKNHKLTITDPEETISKIVEASEGNFLYLRKFVEWMEEKGWIDILDARTYPKGIIGMYQLYFRRQFPDIEKYEKYQVPLLELVVAAYEPLPESLAEKIIGWQGRERIKVLDPLGSLFERQNGNISPFHKSLKDWLVNPYNAGDYYISIVDGHRKLADYGWSQYEISPYKMDAYHLKWLPMHLIQNEEYYKFKTLLKNYKFIMVKAGRNLLDSLKNDYLTASNILPPEFNTFEIKLISEAINIGEKIICNDPSLTFQCLYNLLKWSNDDEMKNILKQWRLFWEADNVSDTTWLELLNKPKEVPGESAIKYIISEGFVCNALSFSRDGKRLAGAGNKSVKIWDVENNIEISELKLPHAVNGGLIDISWSNNDQWIAAIGFLEGYIALWDTSSYELKYFERVYEYGKSICFCSSELQDSLFDYDLLSCGNNSFDLWFLDSQKVPILSNALSGESVLKNLSSKNIETKSDLAGACWSVCKSGLAVSILFEDGLTIQLAAGIRPVAVSNPKLASHSISSSETGRFLSVIFDADEPSVSLKMRRIGNDHGYVLLDLEERQETGGYRLKGHIMKMNILERENICLACEGDNGMAIIYTICPHEIVHAWQGPSLGLSAGAIGVGEKVAIATKLNQVLLLDINRMNDNFRQDTPDPIWQISVEEKGQKISYASCSHYLSSIYKGSIKEMLLSNDSKHYSTAIEVESRRNINSPTSVVFVNKNEWLISGHLDGQLRVRHISREDITEYVVRAGIGISSITADTSENYLVVCTGTQYDREENTARIHLFQLSDMKELFSAAVGKIGFGGGPGNIACFGGLYNDIIAVGGTPIMIFKKKGKWLLEKVVENRYGVITGIKWSQFLGCFIFSFASSNNNGFGFLKEENDEWQVFTQFRDGGILSLDVSSCGRFFAFTDLLKNCWVYYVKDDKKMVAIAKTIITNASEIWSVTFSIKNNLVIFGDANGQMHVFRINGL